MFETMNRIGTTGSNMITTTDTAVVDSSSGGISNNNNDRYNNINNNNDDVNTTCTPSLLSVDSGGGNNGIGSGNTVTNTSNGISTSVSDVDMETITANTYFLSTGDIECIDDHLKSYSNILLPHQVSPSSASSTTTTTTTRNDASSSSSSSSPKDTLLANSSMDQLNSNKENDTLLLTTVHENHSSDQETDSVKNDNNNKKNSLPDNHNIQGTNDQQEECPVCCLTFQTGDILYPLYCPTISCHYNFCTNCILQFMKAASDGYSIASDGSQQVKIKIQCPMCRCRYQIPKTNTNTNVITTTTTTATATTSKIKITSQQQQLQKHKEQQKQKQKSRQMIGTCSTSKSIEAVPEATGTSTSTNYSSDQIIHSLLLLRNAVRVQELIQNQKGKNNNDSELKASDLQFREKFLSMISINDLENAVTIVQIYQNEIVNQNDHWLLLQHSTGNSAAADVALNQLRVQPLDWNFFQQHLTNKPTSNVSINSSCSSISSKANDSKNKPNIIELLSPTPDNIGSQTKSTTTSTSSSSSGGGTSASSVVVSGFNGTMIPFKDPTLFGGLEELMTVAEHEFLTSLFISNKMEFIAQAVSILNGIMELAATRRVSSLTATTAAATSSLSVLRNTATATARASRTATTLQQNRNARNHYLQRHPLPPTQSKTMTTKTMTVTSSESSTSSSSSSYRPVRLSQHVVEQMYKMKKRFPLPVNMPRCVQLPLYDPLQYHQPHDQQQHSTTSSSSSSSNNNKAEIQFYEDLNNKHMYTLMIKQVTGHPARVLGLRKNDIITHVDGNVISSYDEYIITMQNLLHHSYSSPTIDNDGNNATTTTRTVPVIVNATDEITAALYERGQSMIRNQIRFQYD